MIRHHFTSGVQLKDATSQRLLLIGVTQVVSPRYVGVSSGRGLRPRGKFAVPRGRRRREEERGGVCARVYACLEIDVRGLRASRLNDADNAGRRQDEDKTSLISK